MLNRLLKSTTEFSILRGLIPHGYNRLRQVFDDDRDRRRLLPVLHLGLRRRTREEAHEARIIVVSTGASWHTPRLIKEAHNMTTDTHEEPRDLGLPDHLTAEARDLVEWVLDDLEDEGEEPDAYTWGALLQAAE